MEQTFKGKPGDLIEINRSGFQHWAVYIGGNEVVHYGKDGGKTSGTLELLSSSPGNVMRQKLTDVVCNDTYQVNNLKDKECKAREPSVIVEEACAMVGRKPPYNLVTNNCEHFATEMRYGEAESRQAKAAVIRTVAPVAAVASVVAVPSAPVGAALFGGIMAFFQASSIRRSSN